MGKVLKRKEDDLDSAITKFRTLLESTLKNILDELNTSYLSNPKIHELYKKFTNELNLSPEQYNEKIFKKILRGCSGILRELESLRNAFGDAKSKGRIQYKLDSRHEEFVVNISETMCLFFGTVL